MNENILRMATTESRMIKSTPVEKSTQPVLPVVEKLPRHFASTENPVRIAATVPEP